ncbi:Putative L,D-transpeptidase YkuD [Rosistilla oblonga]|uniref:L,D-transpeptidase family protein n=1 Tax=Rosistilla oblonga TaxID=2527990 RepID=UPI00118AA485|nr:LysM peptidoglycan-binding domain-containing protein [Rosistilla oblonga]QDV12140.1 Putative L,D-transpeptidase YkuD [Rosistilla oblonga]
MQTIKTAVVTVLLLVVLYGAYVAINTPPVMMPDELQALVEQDGLQIDDGAIDVPEIEVPPFGDSFGGTISSTQNGVVASLSSDSPDSTGEDSSSDSDPLAALPPLNFGSDDSATTESESRDDEVSAAPLMTQALPKPADSSPAIAADPDQTYPETPMAGLSLSGPAGPAGDEAESVPSAEASLSDSGSGFQMPSDPNAAAAEQPAAETPSSDSAAGIDNAIQTADRQVAAGELREALFTLSLFYGSPDLTDEQVQQLMPRLNALAGEVVYSRRHLIESAYRVQPGDTLQSIADARHVPVQVLANINGITDPASLVPGTELKVFTGPFRAEIDLSNSKLALFLGDLFAGAFAVKTGTSPSPVEGTFAIQAKQKARAYYGMDGTTFAAGDPRNPYGEFWIDLGDRLSIHGSPSMQPGVSGLGCIQMNTADARDVYGILSEGSSVTIRR